MRIYVSPEAVTPDLVRERLHGIVDQKLGKDAFGTAQLTGPFGGEVQASVYRGPGTKRRSLIAFVGNEYFFKQYPQDGYEGLFDPDLAARFLDGLHFT